MNMIRGLEGQVFLSILTQFPKSGISDVCLYKELRAILSAPPLLVYVLHSKRSTLDVFITILVTTTVIVTVLEFVCSHLIILSAIVLVY